MRKILMLLILIVSINSFGQLGYQYRTVRERLLAFIVDSGLHVPRYNGVPSGLRNGVHIADGLIAMDTANGSFYGYRNSAWFRVANYADLATASRFGVEDAIAGQNRTFTGLNNTYSFTFDSVNSFTVRRNNIDRLLINSSNSYLLSPNGLSQFSAGNGILGMSAVSGANYFNINSDSSFTPKRISYTSDISGTFTDNSLVTKSYVQGLVAGASTKLNSIIAADGTNTIDNTTHKQEWKWDGLADIGFKLSSVSTAATGQTQSVLQVVTSGANATDQGTFAARFANTHTGASSDNFGVYAEASGAGAANIGVQGNVTNNNGIGVYGSSSVAGIGVQGLNSGTGDGGYFFNSSTGYALRTGAGKVGVFAADIFMNNGSDSAATKAYARSVGGGGGGNVTKVGTPVNDQVGIWTGDGTIEGDADLTFDGTALTGRWKARVGSTTSSATPTINTDVTDIYKLTALAANITSFTTNLSGTPVDGDILEIQITDDGTPRTIAWGASFASSSVALPTTTTASTTLTVILQYYTTSSYGNNKWVCANSY